VSLLAAGLKPRPSTDIVLPAASPSADRWKKGYLVSTRERRMPIRVFLVQGRGNRVAKFFELRKTAPVALEKVLDARSVGKLGLLLRAAYDFLQLAKEEHAHSHKHILQRPGAPSQFRLIEFAYPA
jgi:hypothetical protein